MEALEVLSLGLFVVDSPRDFNDKLRHLVFRKVRVAVPKMTVKVRLGFVLSAS